MGASSYFEATEMGTKAMLLRVLPLKSTLSCADPEFYQKLAALNSFSLFRPHQHGIAKEKDRSLLKINNCESVMLVECGLFGPISVVLS